MNTNFEGFQAIGDYKTARLYAIKMPRWQLAVKLNDHYCDIFQEGELGAFIPIIKKNLRAYNQ